MQITTSRDSSRSRASPYCSSQRCNSSSSSHSSSSCSSSLSCTTIPPVPLPFHPRPTLSASSGNMTRIHICYSCMIHKPILRFGCTTVVAVRSLFFLKAYLFLPCWNKTVLFAVRNKLYSICRFVFLWKYRLDKLYLCLRNVILGASIASQYILVFIFLHYSL